MKITRCKICKMVQYRLLELFVLEVIARSAADIVGIQPNSAALFYHKISHVIAFNLATEAHEVFQGNIEIDESYFGGVRNGKRGLGVSEKVIVFGMLKRHGKVYTVVVENTKAKTLLNEIALKIKPDSVVYTDAHHSYDALDVSEFHHHRINHSEIFVDEKNHINEIENFWNQAKRVLKKYNLIDRSCKKFCVNGYTTQRSEYGHIQGSLG